MKKYIGNKAFYMMVLSVAVPIMIQNGITNFVGFLDNIMVGQIGTEQMTGVAIVNQLFMVYNICIFGMISGAGIFGTQFYGSGNIEGLRNTFRFKVVSCTIFAFAAIIIFLVGGSGLIQAFLHEGSSQGNIELAKNFGIGYLQIMMIGMIPYAATQIYASTLRETGETLIPMAASIVAVLVNLVFNYILIFGKIGAPVLGVNGAAIATVLSRFIEMGIVISWTHMHKEKNEFIQGIYRTLKVPAFTAKQIIMRGTPLMVNEALWAGGMAVLTQCYSMRGISVIAAYNISSTISNLFNVVFLAIGNSIAIIVGQLLGAGKMEEARDVDRKLIFFSTSSCLIIGLLMAAGAPLFPKLYNTTSEVKQLAQSFIVIAALCMPLFAFMHACYFTLRSGGKTVITFLFDSVFVWVANIPLAYVLSRYTNMNIVWLYLCCQLLEFVKCVIGFVLVKSGIWVHNIAAEE